VSEGWAAMKETREKWIEAGKILGKTPEAKVLCPTCGEGFLQVMDYPQADEPNRVTRYLRCRRCGAQEVLVGADKP